MPRRTKKGKKLFLLKEIKLKKGSSSLKTPIGFLGPKKSGKGEKNLRFSVSLIILTAALEMSLLILLFSLVNSQALKEGNNPFYVAAANSNGNKKNTPSSQELSDPGLNFKLTIPPQLGDWKYRVGYVKSPVDDALSNQYLQVYIPESGRKKSHNFDEANKAFLTVRKFESEEWDSLKKGCEKGNLIFCEVAGEKIAEKNGSIYAYTKNSSCLSNKNESKCKLVEKIVGSFQFK